MTMFRLPFFAQESPFRRAQRWLTMAENWWSHDGRKLTPYRELCRDERDSDRSLDHA